MLSRNLNLKWCSRFYFYMLLLMSDTLIPKFIPLYPSVLQHYGVVESSILGYLDFFQYYNKDFNCTNEDLSKILNVSERTVATAIKNLSKGWEIVLSKKMREWGWILRNISIWKNCILQSEKSALSKMQNLHSYNIYNNKEQKEIKESENIPSVIILLEAYRKTPELVRKIKDESVVRQRAEYKQRRKSKAYKSVDWFLQQLVENITIVSNWEIRYDIWPRLRYAQNKAITEITNEYDGMIIWRNDMLIELNLIH